MDYWEGILLGPVWTDSDIRPRNKRSLMYLVVLVWLAALGLAVVFPQVSAKLPLGATSSGLLALGLFLVMPLAGAYYYRIPIYTRPLVLLGYLVSYLLMLNSTMQLALSKLQIDLESLPELVLDFINLRIEEVAHYFKSLEGIEGAIISVVLGAAYVGLIVVAAGVLIFLLACLFLYCLVGLQRLWDRFLEGLLFPAEQGEIKK